MKQSSHPYPHAVSVLGLGVTGCAAVHYFAKRGVAVYAADDRAHETALDLPQTCVVSYGTVDLDKIKQTEQLIISPGINPTLPRFDAIRQAGVAIVSDIDVFSRYCMAPIIAITGTNGKSTVASMVADILTESGFSVGLGGNIGHACLAMLDEPQKDYYVLEVSSFQLQSVRRLNARVACIINISPDHLDRHTDFLDYSATKHKIYAHAESVVFNADDEHTYPKITHNRSVCFTQQMPQADALWGIGQQEGKPYLQYGDMPLMPVHQLKRQATHDVANALCAAAICSSVDVSWDAIASALARFSGLAHRYQKYHHLGITWVNDSKATNIGSAMAAVLSVLAECNGKFILIVGGDNKGVSLAALNTVLNERCRVVIALGLACVHIQTVLNTVSVVPAQHMTEAVDIANTWAQKNDWVVLAPACASTDMFDNYQHRGDHFMNAVKALG